MELVEGQSLDRILRERGPSGAGEAAVIAQDLCAALAAVHAAGLLHRDVKAQNVMREEGGRIVLMDFGTGEELPRRRAAGRAWSAHRCTWRPRFSAGSRRRWRRISIALACCCSTSSPGSSLCRRRRWMAWRWRMRPGACGACAMCVRICRPGSSASSIVLSNRIRPSASRLPARWSGRCATPPWWTHRRPSSPSPGSGRHRRSPRRRSSD